MKIWSVGRLPCPPPNPELTLLMKFIQTNLAFRSSPFVRFSDYLHKSETRCHMKSSPQVISRKTSVDNRVVTG